MTDAAPAAPTARPGTGPEGTGFILFRAGGARFALDIRAVLEINRPGAVTRVPQAPPWARGIVNLRGGILSILDLARLLGLPEGGAPGALIVVGEGRESAGFLAEAVEDAVEAAPGSLLPPPPHLARPLAAFVTGVHAGGGHHMVLSPSRLLDPSAAGREGA